MQRTLKLKGRQRFCSRHRRAWSQEHLAVEEDGHVLRVHGIGLHSEPATSINTNSMAMARADMGTLTTCHGYCFSVVRKRVA